MRHELNEKTQHCELMSGLLQEQQDRLRKLEVREAQVAIRERELDERSNQVKLDADLLL